MTTTKTSVSELGRPDLTVADRKEALRVIRGRHKHARMGRWSKWVETKDTYYPYGKLRWRRAPWYTDPEFKLIKDYSGYVSEVEYF